MASKNTTIALLVVLNLVFFTIASACGTCPMHIPKPKPYPKTSSFGPMKATCPRDALKLGVCTNLLGGLIGVTIATPPITPCCTLIEGLLDLEAAVCLCTAIKVNLLDINVLNLPIALSLLLGVCSKNIPPDFQCA